jgi:flagellin-like protein
MKASNLFNADDRAVSPVIGVILMVAITVILAAVIGTFVLGLGDQIGGSATAGVTVDGDSTDTATVTLTNTGTSESVTIVNSSDGNEITSGFTGSLPMNNTGASVDVTAQGDYNIVAIGPNGERSVLRSFNVTAP